MTTEENQLQASISALFLSISSSAAMALGLAPNPSTGSVHVDKKLAKFNIDLLLELEQKTKGNLTGEEKQLLDSLLQDLRVKFVQSK